LMMVNWPTRYEVTLPEDAQPGTYVAVLKVHRQFLGERTATTGTFPFQVGQATRTDYPSRVGNCQICHRSVLSMENLRHGMAGDDVEACKTCHSTVSSNVNTMVHQIHMLSEKYPMD